MAKVIEELWKQKWYKKLIKDCKTIIAKERLDLIKRKHELGSRIIEEKETIPYGDMTSFTDELAKDLGYSRSELYSCTQFAKRWPDFNSFMNEFSDKSENLTWYNIVHEWLAERKPGEKKIGVERKEIEYIYTGSDWLCEKCGALYKLLHGTHGKHKIELVREGEPEES